MLKSSSQEQSYFEKRDRYLYFNWKSDFNLSLFIIVFLFIINFPIKLDNWIKWKRKKKKIRKI